MDAIELAAHRLETAASTGQTVHPVRDVLGSDLPAAYRVQELVLRQRITESNPRIGRKVGLTSVAVQKQLGVDQPDFGVLLADMSVEHGDVVADRTLFQPRIEAEVAFILHRDVTDASADFVAGSVGSVVASLEIVDSRIERWDISLVDTVADNASSSLFVIGPERHDLADVDTAAVTMQLTADGVVVSQGTGADCLGDPLRALVWVAETALALGRPLLAGEIVLSGALGPMVPFEPGIRYDAQITGLGHVSVSRGKE